jgi:hypothetical protein
VKKVKVKILQSVGGTGDPSAAELSQKYLTMAKTMKQQSIAAQGAGKRGKSDEEIDELVDAEKRRDAKIPRVSGFTGAFSFKPGDTPLIDASLAAKWQESGICIVDEELSRKAA